MPEICRFLGIVIKMFFDDHAPPHFHVLYGEYMAMVDIEKPALIKGYLPPRVHGLVLEWAVLRQKELREDWDRAQNNGTLIPIKPLE